MENPKLNALLTRGVNSPFRLLIIVVVSVFGCEAAVMGFLQLWWPTPTFWLPLVDALLVTALVIPFVYFFLFRPLIMRMNQLNQTQRQLEKERLKFHTILEKLPAYVYLQSSDHKIQFANRRFQELFGENHLQTCYETFYGSKSVCEVCPVFDSLENEETYRWERTLDQNRVYRVYNHFLDDSDDNSLILELGFDITDLKKTEAALRASEEKFRILVDSIDDIVFAIDAECRFVQFYGRWFKKMGIEAKKYLGKSFRDILDKENAEIHEHAAHRAFAGEHVVYNWSIDYGNMHFYFQISLSPIESSEEQYGRVVGVARDVSVQKSMEKELIQTEKLATIGEMTALISHEFRNSLTSVRMLLELRLESNQLSCSEEKALKVMLGSITHMENIVHRMVNFSRPSPMTFGKEDINGIIEESIELVNPHIHKEKITIDTEIDETLPELLLDRQHLKEALVNILLNAIQAITRQADPGSQRAISIKTQKHLLSQTLHDVAFVHTTEEEESAHRIKKPEVVIPEQTPCLLIEIRDSGVGIEPDKLNNIFDPFFTTRKGGTGLGLPMVKRIINMHAGIISMDSVPGQGTTFRLYIPLFRKEYQ